MKKFTLIVGLFFLILLVIGLVLFDDYGLSFDENNQRVVGFFSYKYVFEGDESLFSFKDREYGVSFELPLMMIEQFFEFEDISDVFLMRHLVNFLLFFVSVFFFYLLVKEWLGGWRLGLLGAIFLVLSPRIFAHSFYNSKDLAFMSAFIISSYTMVIFLKRKNLSSAFFHALACAFVIGIRILGVLVPFITFVLFCLDLLTRNVSKKRVKFFNGFSLELHYVSLIVFFLFLSLFTILFWPYLWIDPINHFIGAFKEFSKYTAWGGEVRYFGSNFKGDELPWHYIPFWVLMTTPLLFSGLFFVGLFFFVKRLLDGKSHYSSLFRDGFGFAGFIFIPIFMVIILNSVLYSGWRHLFFIYPFFLLFSLFGFKLLLKHFKSHELSVLFITGLFLLNPLFFMIINHPYENVFFNPLVNYTWAKHNFVFDYWGSSYRQGLEWILANDNRSVINLLVDAYPGELNAFIFPAGQRSRLVYVENSSSADYFLSAYRRYEGPFNCLNEVFAPRVGGARVMIVCKSVNGSFFQ